LKNSSWRLPRTICLGDRPRAPSSEEQPAPAPPAVPRARRCLLNASTHADALSFSLTLSRISPRTRSRRTSYLGNHAYICTTRVYHAALPAMPRAAAGGGSGLVILTRAFSLPLAIIYLRSRGAGGENHLIASRGRLENRDEDVSPTTQHIALQSGSQRRAISYIFLPPASLSLMRSHRLCYLISRRTSALLRCCLARCSHRAALLRTPRRGALSRL